MEFTFHLRRWRDFIQPRLVALNAKRKFGVLGTGLPPYLDVELEAFSDAKGSVHEVSASSPIDRRPRTG